MQEGREAGNHDNPAPRQLGFAGVGNEFLSIVSQIESDLISFSRHGQGSMSRTQTTS